MSARRERAVHAAAAALLAIGALAIAWHGGVKSPDAVPDLLRGGLATIVLLACAGYAPARLLAPRATWPHFPWLVLLVGVPVAGLGLTALGFLALPFTLSLVVLLVAGAGAAIAVRSRLGPARPGAADAERSGGRLATLAWPAYLAVVVMAIALVPVLQNGFATLPGQNPDGLLGAGSARFLQEAYPTSIDESLPIDRMPLVWRSKYPIYYVLAGVSSLSGLETYEAFPALAVLLGALTAVGFMLLARYGLRAGPWASVLAMALVGLDRVLAHLAVHPYHNQLWGTLALPMIVLFGLRLIDRPAGRDAILLALFLAIGLAAYPLMAVFPAVILGAAAIAERRRGGLRRPEGATPLRLPRSRLVLLPVLMLAIPAAAVVGYGVIEKGSDAAELLFLGKSLGPWRGDLTFYRPVGFFAGVPGFLGVLAAGAILVAAALGLRRLPRSAAVGFGAAAAVGIALAVFFRARDFGEYFYFKVLAFLAPLLLVVAALWIAGQVRGRPPRIGRGVAIGATALVALQIWGAGQEAVRTGIQAERATFDLPAALDDVEPDASVRLDVPPDGRQLWAAYLLSEHRLSSPYPLKGTTFPHVPAGLKADYLLAHGATVSPDADGPALARAGPYRLFRMRREVPGRDTSSRRSVDALSTTLD